MIGMPEHVSIVAPTILATASIVDPRTQKSVPFPTWGRMLLELKRRRPVALTQLEEKGLELAHRLDVYQSQRMGMGLEIVPAAEADDAKWLTFAELLLTKFDDASDPRGQLSPRAEFALAGALGVSQWRCQQFNRVSEELCTLLRTVAQRVQLIQANSRSNLEVAYNHWEPFRYAWILMLLATVGMLLHLGSRWRPLYWSAMGSLRPRHDCIDRWFFDAGDDFRPITGHEYVRIGDLRRLGRRGFRYRVSR